MVGGGRPPAAQTNRAAGGSIGGDGVLTTAPSFAWFKEVQEDGQFQVTVFEANDHVGGRVYSLIDTAFQSGPP